MMKTGYLLDTHIILWLTTDDNNLKESTRSIINEFGGVISAISLWEVAIKFFIGKLRLDGGLPLFLSTVNNLNLERIDIRDIDLMTLSNLPRFQDHKDPFDRLLIAQAKTENFTLITNDKNFEKYDVNVILN